jgi:hypothetical protein
MESLKYILPLGLMVPEGIKSAGTIISTWQTREEWNIPKSREKVLQENKFLLVSLCAGDNCKQ